MGNLASRAIGCAPPFYSKMSQPIYALILAGGSGERFWPLSRRTRPKQLLKLVSDRTLLEETVRRLDGLIPPGLEVEFLQSTVEMLNFDGSVVAVNGDHFEVRAIGTAIPLAYRGGR
jgi:hypothetical protein